MAEIAPGGSGPNRLFIVIAIGLVAILLLGLIAVGGILVLPKIFNVASVPPTVRVAVTTPTRSVNVAAATVVPTSTDAPIATATLVLVGTPIVSGGATVTGTGTITATTTITGTGTPGTGTLPKSGLGEDLLLLAGGVVLVLVIFAARRARATGAS
jgi:hypothetical protein